MSAKSDLDLRKIMAWAKPDPADGDVISMLATTYELDPTFFGTDYLPTFLGLGAWEDTSWSSHVSMQRALSRTDATVVMMDARRFQGRPRSLHLEITPAIGPLGSKLHAKILLVVQERAVRLLVSSANLTANGYRYNREVGLPIVARANTPQVSALVYEAVTSMREPLERWWTPAAERVQERALEIMANWPRSQDKEDRFAWSWGDSSLATQFVELWPDEKVLNITIISPFWSDKGNDGPAAILLRQLGADRVTGAKLRLLTEAAETAQNTFRPSLPARLAAWDAGKLGVQGEAQAVNPHVIPAEVNGLTDYRPRRALHAKIVLIEGSMTTLAYIGSANFTQSGWGFGSSRSNIEAGVILKRQGKSRHGLSELIPDVVGSAVPLNGAGQSAISIVEKNNDDPDWPTFIREIRLAPVGSDPTKLALSVALMPPISTVTFSISFVEDDSAVLLHTHKLTTGALDPKLLERVLRDQRVSVNWGGHSVEFPVNVDLEARLLLPVSPESGPPGEKLLLAYYQGRITVDDIYPPPPGGNDQDAEGAEITKILASEVDTTNIQSYQIREFVEALAGIIDDLRSASTSTEAAIRQAVLGDLSPRTLARSVIQSVKNGSRSPTAAGFQLIELLVCLFKADAFDVPPINKEAWLACLVRARKEVALYLKELIDSDVALQPKSTFHRYQAAVLSRYQS